MKISAYLSVFFMIALNACEKDPVEGQEQAPRSKFILLSGKTGHGIIYHDINPDWEKHGFGLFNDSLNIDINGDDSDDVSIKYTTFLSGTEYDQQTSVSCLNGSSISLLPKNYGDTIDFSSTWTNSDGLLCYTKIDFAANDTTSTGAWKDTHDKYLGVKIIKNSRTLFGWIRMSVLVPPEIVYIQQIIVKDYAYRHF